MNDKMALLYRGAELKVCGGVSLDNTQILSCT